MFGLGLLGTAVAERLLAAGHDLHGHDPDPARTAAFAPSAAGRHPPRKWPPPTLVLACLPHSGVTRSLIDVLRDSWRPGQLFLDHTTGDPADAEELGAWFAAREVGYGDATVVGSSAEVAAANAVILMGGTLAVVESARPVLRCYARQVHAVGPVGAGATLKLVVNLVLGLHRAVLARGSAWPPTAGSAGRRAGDPGRQRGLLAGHGTAKDRGW